MNLFDAFLYAIAPNVLFFSLDFFQYCFIGEVKWRLNNYYLTNIFHVSFLTYLLHVIYNYGG